MNRGRIRRWQEHYHEELQAIRLSVSRGSPFGSEQWQKRTARELGLDGAYRERGRPRRSVLTEAEK